MVYSERDSTQKDTSSSAGASSPSDLIARLQKAGNGSRDLDSDIFAFLNPSLFRTARPGSFVTDEKYIKSASDWSIVGITKTAPNYTKSIDAAMSLVPDGWALGISTLAERPMVEIFERVNDRSFSLRADTLPLALCIAALKARSQIESLPANDSAETRLEI